MSTLVQTLEALVRAGATPEMMLEVVRIHEAGRADALAKRRASDADRQQRVRDKRNSVKSRDVTDSVNGHVTPTPRAHVEYTSLPSLRSEEVITPLPTLRVVPPSKAKRPSRRCPVDWSPSETTRQALFADGYSSGELERALTRMRDWEFKTPRSDWDAAYRTWLRKDPPNPAGQHGRSPPPDPKRLTREANYSRALAGAERAAARRE